MIRSVSIKFGGLTFLCYITLSTSATQGFSFCKVLDSEIQNLKPVLALKNILAIGCIYPKELVIFVMVLW